MSADWGVDLTTQSRATQYKKENRIKVVKGRQQIKQTHLADFLINFTRYSFTPSFCSGREWMLNKQGNNTLQNIKEAVQVFVFM